VNIFFSPERETKTEVTVNNC